MITHEQFLRIALIIGSSSYCKRLQVGAVIVRDNRMISTGYNGTLPGGINNCEDENYMTNADVVHAEANAILYAAKTGIPLNNSIMYVTHSPCENCAKMIIQSGIKEVYIGDGYGNNDGLILLMNNNVKISIKS